MLYLVCIIPLVKYVFPLYFKRHGRWVSVERTHLTKLREHSETEKIIRA